MSSAEFMKNYVVEMAHKTKKKQKNSASESVKRAKPTDEAIQSSKSELNSKFESEL